MITAKQALKNAEEWYQKPFNTLSEVYDHIKEVSLQGFTNTGILTADKNHEKFVAALKKKGFRAYIAEVGSNNYLEVEWG